MKCPCGNKETYQNCCEPLILGKSLPETAEQLMRSRYSAYAVKALDYLKTTLAPEARKDFDAAATKKWADSTHWKKLSILSTKKGTPKDTQGTVEFCAYFETDGKDLQLHEVAEFRKEKDGQWFYVDGDAHTHPAGEDVEHAHAKPETYVRADAKTGRNDPCPCGSGKKFKKCCGG